MISCSSSSLTDSSSSSSSAYEKEIAGSYNNVICVHVDCVYGEVCLVRAVVIEDQSKWRRVGVNMVLKYLFPSPQFQLRQEVG